MKKFLLLLLCIFGFVNGIVIRNQKVRKLMDEEISTATASTQSQATGTTTPYPSSSSTSTFSYTYPTQSQATGVTSQTDGSFSTPGYTTTQFPPFSSNPPTLLPSTLPPSTFQPPTSPQTSGPTNCYGLIFAGEMSQSISLQEKTDFLNIVLKIAANFQNTNLKFAITTYGRTIYKYLNDFQNYNEFLTTVNALIADLPNPNSDLTYIAPVLDDIYNDLILYNGKGISTLFMGEMESIRDPNTGHTAAVKIARTGRNVYVLDYSSGVIPSSLWPYLTNNNYNRIINGTGSDATTIYNRFYNTLVFDIFNNNC